MRTFFPVRDYDLAATLEGGQAFRWHRTGAAWEGVIGRRWVRLTPTATGIEAETATAVTDWRWLADYLQVNADLDALLASFPDDEPMRAAVARCRGLRLLRQEPWECLASFIVSSTKQIVQIRQIVEALCRCFGEPVPGGASLPSQADALTEARTKPCPTAAGFAWHSFPSATRMAQCTEAEIRACKAGFRAPYLLAAARMVESGELPLEALGRRSLDEARQALMRVPGVGPKIADCVLLFAFDFPTAFPVDVWVMRALRQLYFPRRRPTPRRLREFVATHFGPNAGLAQQYLFHSIRADAGR